MADIKEILELSEEYIRAHKRMNLRFEKWDESKYHLVRRILDEIHNQLTLKNSFFKSNLYVAENGASSIYLKAGQVPIPNNRNITEKGFEIHFHQLPNGKIWVYYVEHSMNENPKEGNLHLFGDLEDITEDKVTELVYSGIEKSMKSSYLFFGDQ